MRAFAALFSLLSLGLGVVLPSRVASKFKASLTFQLPFITTMCRAGDCAQASCWTSCPFITTFYIPVSVERDWPTQLVSTGSNYSIQVLYALQDRKILTTNSYNLSAVYCEPTTNVSSRTDTVQLLVHGATLSKIMWDFPYQPEKYSWVRHATSEGFSTLTFDQVGAGNNSKPDGLLEAQCQTYVETIHQIVQMLRAGRIGDKTFHKVITIGFSLGAVSLVSLAKQYPADTDALVLHGFSLECSDSKWGYLPSTYTTQSTPASCEATVFYGNFDLGIVPVDFALRDFDTLGASITIPSHSFYVGEYTGPVFLGNGNQDATFCGQHCGVDPYEVYHYFPDAASWTVKIYPETAHLIHLHNTASGLMNDTLNFIEVAGL